MSDPHDAEYQAYLATKDAENFYGQLQAAGHERDSLYQQLAEMDSRLHALIEACMDARDLARTDLVPDGFGMSADQWRQHKLNSIAGSLDRAIKLTREG